MCKHIQDVTLRVCRAPLIRLDKSIGRSRWRITRQRLVNSGSPGFYCMSGLCALRSVCGILRDAVLALLGKVQSVDLYDCSFNKPLPLVGLSARISKMAG